MKKRGFLKLYSMLCLVTVFGYSYWATSWTASQLSTLSDWKSHLIFTPGTVVASKDIYEIDMFLYAFKVAPLMTGVCLLSFCIIVGLLVYFVKKQLSYVERKNIASS